MLYYTDYLIVSPKELAAALKKVVDQEDIRLEFSFNFLRVRSGENIRISVKAVSGTIKPKLIFAISREDCKRLIEFYTKHDRSGALVKLKTEDGKIIFYGWDDNIRRDVGLTVYVKSAELKKAA